MNPKVDAFIKRQDKWQKEMETIRKICLDTQLSEEIKWGKPCYTNNGKNIAIIQPFNNFVALMFFKGALLKDSHNILVEVGPNSRSAMRIEFTDINDIEEIKNQMQELIHEAIKVEEAGLKVKAKEPEEFDLPEELQDKLHEDNEFRNAFEALTPGRQRSYILHISSAKQSKTRISRIEKAKEKIFQGKGYNER